MKKVGLITLHRWYNYGSMLQAYASNYLLNTMGYDCELIDYTPPKIDNRRSYKLYNDDVEWQDLRNEYITDIIKRKKLGIFRGLKLTRQKMKQWLILSKM